MLVRANRYKAAALGVLALAVGGLSSPRAWSQAINLAQGRPFTANCDLLPGWDGLTDGVKTSDEAPYCLATDNSSEFPKRIVIDLGAECTITRVVIHNSANGNTKLVEVAISTDAKDYTTLREYVFPPNKYQPLVHRCTPRKARFVRITFRNTWGNGLGCKNIIYLREAEVYGKRLGHQDTNAASLWTELTAAKPERPSPGWSTAKRYLAELKRSARLAVISDQDAEPLMGPSGWIPRALRQVEEPWTRNGVQANFVEFNQDHPEDYSKELKALLKGMTPDLVIVAPAGPESEAFLAEVPRLLAEASKVTTNVLVCVPPPKGTGSTGLKEYRKMRRELLVEAAQYNCGVLDVGALLARQSPPTKLLMGKNWVVEAVDLVAGALAKLLR